jgi:hypothetical protein
MAADIRCRSRCWQHPAIVGAPSLINNPGHPSRAPRHKQGRNITVNFTTTDGTATAPADYTATSGTLTFSPGQTRKTVTVDVVGEKVFEGNELFWLVLSSPVNAIFGVFSLSKNYATISNDDAAPSFSIAPASYPEGTACATNSGGLVVTLSNAAVRLGMGSLKCTDGCAFVCICVGRSL